MVVALSKKKQLTFDIFLVAAEDMIATRKVNEAKYEVKYCILKNCIVFKIVLSFFCEKSNQLSLFWVLWEFVVDEGIN